MEDKKVRVPKQVVAMAAAAGAAETPAPPAAVVAPTKEIAGQPAIAVEKPAVETPADQAGKHDFEQLYKTLKGKYDAEVPVLSRRVTELTRDVADLQQQIDAAKESAVLTDEERDGLGEEILGPMEKMIAQVRLEAAQSMAPVLKELFFSRLDAICLQWRKLNEDPAFLAWLSGDAPLTGMKRHQLFDEASQKLDATVCGQFFNAYLAENNLIPAAPVPGDISVPPPVLAGAGAEKPQRKFKESEVQAFYADAVKGRYRSNPAEYARIDAEISAAVKEGRIIKG